MRFLTRVLPLMVTAACHSSDGSQAEFRLDSIELVEAFDLEAEGASRVAREANRYIEAVGGGPAYREVLLGMGVEPDPRSVGQAGAFLAMAGAVRLGKNSTDSLAALRSAWIQRFGCEAVVRGGPGTGWRLMASMDSTELADLFGFLAETTRAVMDEAGEVPEFDRNRLVHAWRSFHSRLPPGEQSRFVRFLDAPAQSPEDRCWFQRRLWELLPRLPEEDSRIILWQLATDEF